MLRLVMAGIVFAATLSPPPGRAEPQGGSSGVASEEAAKGGRPTVADICRTLSQAAASNGLPEEFFTRLIWQ